MSRPCHECESLIGRARGTLSEAQRLLLEQHLQTCEPCRALHTMSLALGAALRDAPTELGAGARERAIAGAFMRAAAPPPRRVRWSVRALSGVAVAAAALVFFFFSTTLQPPADTWIEGVGARTFAHARVTLGSDARVRFDARSATLSLARGALEVEVDPRPQAPFAVETANFRAQVLGTSFHIDATHVLVRHGHVRVSAGSRLLADLHSGQAYHHGPAGSVEDPRPAAASASQPLASPASQPAESPQRATRPTREPPRRRKAEPKAEREAPGPDVSALLARARSAIAHDALREAGALLEQAEGAARREGDRAEAGTLRAEIALRERDQPGAIRAYLAVAARFPELASGENALFAAAQLSSAEQARRLLERYLARYPQGRFAEQARARLRAATR